MIGWVLRLAWRDSRRARPRLLFCALSVVFGVAALVALGSLGAAAARAIHVQAKGLLGADLTVTSRRPFSLPVRRYLQALGGRRAEEAIFSSMMTPPKGAPHLVMVHALQGPFPFYGEMTTAPAEAASRLRRGGNVAVLEEALLIQLGVGLGERVKLGRTEFTVIGSLRKMPGDSFGAALLAPRALIPLSALAATGLEAGGSLARYRAALELPPGRDAGGVAREMEGRFPEERLSFETARSRESDLGQSLQNVYGYLGLVGFVAVLLGAIGLGGAMQVYAREKLATVAILRCLGAGAGRALAVYVVQGAAVGGLGAALGAALGVALQAAAMAGLRGALPFPVGFSVEWRAVAHGIEAGLAVSLLFTLLPLLAVRRVPPLAALRAAEAERSGGRPDPWRWAVGALLGAAVLRIALGLTHDYGKALLFAGLSAAALGLLGAGAWAAARAARRLRLRRLPFALRQGVANLHRPNNRTVLLLVAVGLGTFLTLTVALARATLGREIEEATGGDRPDLVFLDIQDDQIGPVDRLLRSESAPPVEQAPIVTMTIAAVNGRTPDQILSDPSSRVPAWTLRREYRSTFRGSLTDSERLVEGKFVGRVPPEAEIVPVSMEEGLRREMGLRLGARVDWNVQGVILRTRVASVRHVEWRRLEPNFFVVFPEGPLAAAPKFYVAAVRAATAADSARLQRAVVGAFPNVTAIDVTLVRRTLDGIFSKLELAVAGMALFTVLAGLAVLAGAALAASRQRAREAALLRLLGADRRQLALIELVENASLGMLGAALGCALAGAANALLARFVFHAPAAAPAPLLLAAIAAAPALTLATGWLAGRSSAGMPPLELLRAES